MSDPTTSLSEPGHVAAALTPGQMIKRAREDAGLHIVALAAALKVPVRKLEALESNHWEELTDATFTRALASSVARHLKMDATLVLAGLPSAELTQLHSPAGLGRVESGGASVGLALKSSMSHDNRIWIAVVLLLGAGALYFSPQIKTFWSSTAHPLTSSLPAKPPAPAVALVVEAVPTPTTTGTATTDSTPPQPSSPPAALYAGNATSALGEQVASTPVSPEQVLAIAASVDTWVEVIDRNKKIRLQRVLKRGEEMVFAEGHPFAIVVGNASGARVTVRGQPFDLSEIARNNVARFEVK